MRALRYIFIKPITSIDFYDVRNRIFIFIDAYRVHKCDEIIDLAAELNIDVTVIPEGMTEVHQPLDIKLFGIMKAKARAFLTTRIANDVLSKYNEETMSFDGPIEPPRAITKREATIIIENAWDDIEKYQITEAWFEAIDKYFTTINSDDDFSAVEQEFQTRLNNIAQQQHQQILRQQQQQQQHFLQQQQLQFLQLIKIKKKKNIHMLIPLYFYKIL